MVPEQHCANLLKQDEVAFDQLHLDLIHQDGFLLLGAFVDHKVVHLLDKLRMAVQIHLEFGVGLSEYLGHFILFDRGRFDDWLLWFLWSDWDILFDLLLGNFDVLHPRIVEEDLLD